MTCKKAANSAGSKDNPKQQVSGLETRCLGRLCKLEGNETVASLVHLHAGPLAWCWKAAAIRGCPCRLARRHDMVGECSNVRGRSYWCLGEGRHQLEGPSHTFDADGTLGRRKIEGGLNNAAGNA